MKRVAFKMKLHPGKLEEYRKRHNAIWPQLAALLKEKGIAEYAIFLDTETHTLFAFQKVEGTLSSQELGRELLVQKWWAYMADIMEVNADNSPVTTELNEVFYLE